MAGTTLGDVTARPPPAVVVDNAARLDGGTSPGSILVPIHVVDRAERATVVTIEPKVPAPDIVRWQLEPGGTPPEGRAYTMNVPADAGAYYSTSLTVTACNVSGGGLCALPVAKERLCLAPLTFRQSRAAA